MRCDGIGIGVGFGWLRLNCGFFKNTKLSMHRFNFQVNIYLFFVINAINYTVASLEMRTNRNTFDNMFKWHWISLFDKIIADGTLKLRQNIKLHSFTVIAKMMIECELLVRSTGRATQSCLAYSMTSNLWKCVIPTIK